MGPSVFAGFCYVGVPKFEVLINSAKIGGAAKGEM